MSKKNRTQRRFLQGKGKEIMKEAMIEKAKTIAIDERMRAYAWRRAFYFICVIVAILGVALAGAIVSSVNLNKQLEIMEDKCR